MPGTVTGGQRAAATNKKRHGEDFYVIQGAKGGKAKVSTKGFGYDKEKSRRLGILGGKRSRKGYIFLEEKAGKTIYARKSDGKIVEFES